VNERGEQLHLAVLVLGAGFGRSTIYTAREALKDEIVNTAGRRSAGNCWRLASRGDAPVQSEGAE
jgi:hypothetical protein